MMQKEIRSVKLEVILMQTFDRKPLITVSNGLPGLYADLAPAQIRVLAAARCMAADEGELQPMGRFRQKKRTYDLLITR